MEIISSWNNLIRSLILLIALLFGIFFIVEKIIGNRSLNLTVAGTEIKIGDNGALKNHLVPPRGWTDSGISVKKGDKITIKSTGSINVAMAHMLDKLNNFIKILKTKEDMNVELFTKNEIDAATFTFPWNDAKGISLTKMDNIDAIKLIKSTSHKLLDPTAKFGQLLIYNFEDETVHPHLEQLTELDEVYQFEGDAIVLEIKGDGRIYFGINDVVLFDKSKSELLWQDNVGFFSVTTFTQYAED
ncbi:MAG: hypothetical protein JKY48_02520 [Flavobacteriales bacterium]|nr:hypothetical protein [Flavobacteriales bacterium]